MKNERGIDYLDMIDDSDNEMDILIPSKTIIDLPKENSHDEFVPELFVHECIKLLNDGKQLWDQIYIPPNQSPNIFTMPYDIISIKNNIYDPSAIMYMNEIMSMYFECQDYSTFYGCLNFYLNCMDELLPSINLDKYLNKNIILRVKFKL